MSSEKDNLAAVLDLMGGADRGAYSLHGLEVYKSAHDGDLPESYNEVHVMERASDGPGRTSLGSEIRQWRIFNRSVAQDYENAQEMRRRARLLHEALLVVAGERFYIRRDQTDDPIGPDDGWWSGTSEFIY